MNMYVESRMFVTTARTTDRACKLCCHCSGDNLCVEFFGACLVLSLSMQVSIL